MNTIEKNIYKTYNYAMFKKLETNRDIRCVKAYKKNIEAIDLTDLVPIVVSKNYEILDGQHRFEACMELGKPIYYVISGDEHTPEEVMIALNTATKVWRQEEWYNYYLKSGCKNYVRMKEMEEKYNLGISNNILLFSNGKTNAKLFKNGKLVDDSKYWVMVYNFVQDIQLPFKKRREFIASLLRFIEKYENEPKKIEKLKKKIIGVPKFAGMEQYLTAFENLVGR